MRELIVKAIEIRMVKFLELHKIMMNLSPVIHKLLPIKFFKLSQEPCQKLLLIGNIPLLVTSRNPEFGSINLFKFYKDKMLIHT